MAYNVDYWYIPNDRLIVGGFGLPGAYEGKEHIHLYRIDPKIKLIMGTAFENVMK